MASLLLQVVINGLLIGGFYALVGVGLNIIFGVMKIVNFSQGEFLMMGMYMAWVLNTTLHLDPYVVLPIAALVLFALGAIIQNYLITPMLGTATDANQVFLTVALMLLFQNLAQMVFSANYRSVTTPYSTLGFRVFSSVVSLPKLISFLMVLIVALALYLFLMRTEIGKALRATSQNSLGAQLVGIPIKKMYMLAFGLGTGLAGAAGTLLVPFYYVFPLIGDIFTPRAFVVVVLGGLGSIKGAFFGGLIIGLLETAGGFLVGPEFKESLVFVTFILILLFRRHLELKAR